MVQVDGEDWRDMQRRVSKLEADHAALKNAVDGLGTQQLALHKINQNDITFIKVLLEGEGDDNPGIKMKLDRVIILVNTRFDDVVRLIKSGAWAIGILIAIMIAWFGSLEYRHKLNTENQTPTISSEHAPQDSGNQGNGYQPSNPLK